MPDARPIPFARQNLIAATLAAGLMVLALCLPRDLAPPPGSATHCTGPATGNAP